MHIEIIMLNYLMSSHLFCIGNVTQNKIFDMANMNLMFFFVISFCIMGIAVSSSPEQKKKD